MFKIVSVCFMILAKIIKSNMIIWTVYVVENYKETTKKVLTDT